MTKFLQYYIFNVVVFMLSLNIPFIGIILPFYNINNNRKLSINKIIFLKTFILTTIFFISSINSIKNAEINIVLYFLLYFGVELLYYFLKNKEFQIKEFDKILAASIILSSIGVLYFVFRSNVIIEILNQNMEETRKIITENFNPEKVRDFEAILKSTEEYIKSYGIFFLYCLIFGMNFFTYIFLKGNPIKTWELNYYWLVPFSVMFIATSLFDMPKRAELYMENFSLMVFLSYYVFGIKELFIASSRFIRNNIINSIIVFLLSLNFPGIIFIYGGFMSFRKK